MTDDVAEDERALTEGVGAVWLDRDLVHISGADAESFLQGQLSQDVGALGPAASALSFLLAPQGKVDAIGRLTRLEDGTFLFDTDSPYGEAVMTRLNRFKLRVECTVEALPWQVLALRGPEAHEAAHGCAGLTLDADWPSLPGVDLVGEAPEVPEGVRLCSSQVWDAVRIAHGVPRMGAELDERTIPAESGLVDRAVSFTKGCYTGQELVARIDSRGHVNRHLRRLSIEGAAVPTPGATLLAEEREVGVVTSAASAPRLGVVALGYVRRELAPPATVDVRWGDGTATARVEVGP